MTTEEAITGCPKISLDDYQIGQVSYSSSYGQVYIATDKKTGKKVAIKLTMPDNNKEIFLRSFIREVNTANLNLPGIVRIVGYRFPLSEKNNGSEFDGKYIIVSEFVENGSLDDLTKQYLNSNGQQHDKMNPTIRSKVIFGIAATMKKLHKMNIIHRDL
ncbi:hypothetical protein M9Y10_003956 [Tritrichomonas musculus]|uniref:Protein kinase domain-containing protein n=1 Tax=Tritrichomonas musculus TaxID=1915356 RepID=A0ABR2JSM4_9EUKA